MTAQPLSGLHILVLEDEFLIAMDIEQICRDNGAADVTIRRSLEEAQRDAPTVKVDAAVIDLMLAGQPTQPFAKALEQQNVPFVFASGYSDLGALQAEFPKAGILGKPFSEADLVSALQSVLSGR